MAFNSTCFNNCVRGKLSWKSWIAFGAVAAAAFLVAYFQWHLPVEAAAIWAAAVFAAAIAGVLVLCFFKCR